MSYKAFLILRCLFIYCFLSIYLTIIVHIHRFDLSYFNFQILFLFNVLEYMNMWIRIIYNVYICICDIKFILICVFLCLDVFPVCFCVWFCLRVYMCVGCVCVCMFVCLWVSVCMYEWMCVCMYLCVCLCFLCVCVCVFLWMLMWLFVAIMCLYSLLYNYGIIFFCLIMYISV